MEEMMQTSRLYIVPLTLDHAEKVYALTSQEKVPPQTPAPRRQSCHL